MLDVTRSLPENPAELRAFTTHLLAEVNAQAVLIQKLQHPLAGHPAHRFGASSETSDQLQLALEMSGIAIAAMTAKRRQPEDAAADKPKRKPIPDHIPRIEVGLTPGSADCARCGGKLRRLGEDVTEDLDYVPGPSPSSLNRWRTMARHCEPHPAAPDGLFRLRSLHPSPAANPPDRARATRSGPAGACAGQHLCGSLAAVSPKPDLRPRRP